MDKLVKANQNEVSKAKQDFMPSEIQAKTMSLYAKEYGLVPGVHYAFLGGNPYITADGLLWLGNNHPNPAKRIAGIKTEIVKADFDKNQFIVKAIVFLESGQQYEGIGTATKENLTKITANHGLEMAETRAVSRALRKAYAIGIPTLEELKEGEIPAQNTVGKEAEQKQERKISDPQRKRLYAIAKGKGLEDSEIKRVLDEFGYESTKDIRIEDYDKIVSFFENLDAEKDLLTQLEEYMESISEQ